MEMLFPRLRMKCGNYMEGKKCLERFGASELFGVWEGSDLENCRLFRE